MSDRKKATEGRRGRVKQGAVAHKKEETASTGYEKKKDDSNKKVTPEKTATKKRSAGLRRIAVSKNIAAPTDRKKPVKSKKDAAPKVHTAKKGFAPWNKKRFKKKD